MKKTLLDLYLSASAQALKAQTVTGAMALVTFKAEAFAEEKIDGKDADQWSSYFDEQVGRYANLSRQPAPSSPTE